MILCLLRSTSFFLPHLTRIVLGCDNNHVPPPYAEEQRRKSLASVGPLDLATPHQSRIIMRIFFLKGRTYLYWSVGFWQEGVLDSQRDTKQASEEKWAWLRDPVIVWLSRRGWQLHALTILTYIEKKKGGGLVKQCGGQVIELNEVFYLGIQKLLGKGKTFPLGQG